MRSLRLMRNLANGMPCMLLAALLLFARLVAPVMAMPIATDDPLSSWVQQTICHSDAPDAPPSRSDHSDHRDCLLCPACHLASHAVLPQPVGPAVPPPTAVPISVATPLPPATRPTHQVRTAAQPTGPPDRSA